MKNLFILGGSGFYLFITHQKQNDGLLEFRLSKDHSKIKQDCSEESILSVLWLKNRSIQYYSECSV